MLRRVALVRTDVSEELSASFIGVTTIGELGTSSSETSVLTRATRRNIAEDAILQSIYGWRLGCSPATFSHSQSSYEITSGTLLCQRLSKPRDHGAAGRIRHTELYSGNRNRDLLGYFLTGNIEEPRSLSTYN
jgi:hypothetical protein